MARYLHNRDKSIHKRVESEKVGGQGSAEDLQNNNPRSTTRQQELAVVNSLRYRTSSSAERGIAVGVVSPCKTD